MNIDSVKSQPSYSSFSLLRGIWIHLKPRRQNQLKLMPILMLSSGIAESISIGGIIPFLSILSGSNTDISNNIYIKSIISFLGLSNQFQLKIFFAIFFTVLVVLSASLRLLNSFCINRLYAAIGSDLSCEVYRHIICQPYSAHLVSNSSTAIANITAHVNRTSVAVKILLQMITSILISVSIIVGLFLIDWITTSLIILLFGISYFLLGYVTIDVLMSNSLKVARKSKAQIKTLQEGLSAIREVILGGYQSYYLDLYRKSDFPLRRSQAQNNFLQSSPKFLIEPLGILFLVLITLYISISSKNPSLIFPTLGAFALGAQKLLPSLQGIFGGWSTLKSTHSSQAEVVNILSQAVLENNVKMADCYPLNWNTRIKFSNVYFRFNPNQPYVLNNLNFEIYCGESVGIIGTTGSGKSTTIDLLMSLLEPSAGKILIDNIDISDPTFFDRIQSWRSCVAHVPQTIFLSDASIAENIAFGIPPQYIDMNRVRQAAQQAHIADYIESNPFGYENVVGERGIRLSGGQRQRIGIARALYKQSQVLILDEATSALDDLTESRVIKSIENLNENITIIMVAHRLSTLRKCSRLIKLDKGVLVGTGTPDELLPR